MLDRELERALRGAQRASRAGKPRDECNIGERIMRDRAPRGGGIREGNVAERRHCKALRCLDRDAGRVACEERRAGGRVREDEEMRRRLRAFDEGQSPAQRLATHLNASGGGIAVKITERERKARPALVHIVQQSAHGVRRLVRKREIRRDCAEERRRTGRAADLLEDEQDFAQSCLGWLGAEG